MDGQNYFTTQGQTGTMTSTFSHLPASISSIYQSLPDCDLRAPSIVNTTVVDNLLCYVRLDNAQWLNRLSATISRRPPVQFSSIGKPSFLVKLFSSLVFGGGGKGLVGTLFSLSVEDFFSTQLKVPTIPFTVSDRILRSQCKHGSVVKLRQLNDNLGRENLQLSAEVF